MAARRVRAQQQLVERAAAAQYRLALLNFYPGGATWLGPHQDADAAMVEVEMAVAAKATPWKSLKSLDL